MSSLSTLAVAAPVAHIQSHSTAQPAFVPSAGNYAGGVAIAAALTVMVVTGLSIAGIIKPRKSAKVSHHETPHTAH